MNNLLQKGARWIIAIIVILIIVAAGVWFFPWIMIIKIIISAFFGILAGLCLFVGLFMSGPQ